MKPEYSSTHPTIDPVTVIILLIFFIFLQCFAHDPAQLLSPKFGMIPLPEQNQIMVQDFSNLYHYVKGVFQQLSEHPYRISEMNRMLTPWTGGSSGFMPFLSPPTILLSFGPLTLLPAGIAYSLWTLISFLGAGWTVASCRRLGLNEKWWPLLIGYLAYFNFTSMMAINLGQTVFLTNSALLTLYLISFKSNRASIWFAAALVILLTGKPQISLVALFFLFAENHWKTLFLAAAGTLLFCIAITPLFSATWPLDYIHTMSRYGSNTAPMEISETIRTTIMTNFRALSVESGFLPDTLAVHLSWALFLAGGLALYPLKRRLPQLPPALVFSLSCMLYLLFSPHLNPHEDLLLLPALYTTLSVLPERKLIHWIAASLVLLFGLQLNMDMGVGFTALLRPFQLVFAAKALFTLYLGVLCLQHQSLPQMRLFSPPAHD